MMPGWLSLKFAMRITLVGIATLCLVRGYDLGFPAWDGEGPSFETRFCCGIQVGYTDCAGGSAHRRQILYQERRRNWIKQGMKWGRVGESPPAEWDPMAATAEYWLDAKD